MLLFHYLCSPTVHHRITVGIIIAEVDCGRPPAVANTNLGFGATLFQNFATYVCLPGYEVSHNKGLYMTTCQGNKSWSEGPGCKSKSFVVVSNVGHF